MHHGRALNGIVRVCLGHVKLGKDGLNRLELPLQPRPERRGVRRKPVRGLCGA